MTRRSPRNPTWLERLARSSVLRGLRRLTGGTIHLTEERRSGLIESVVGQPTGDAGSPAPLDVDLLVRDPAFWPKLALGGSIGAAEAFVESMWESSNVTDVVRLIARNPNINNDLERGWAARAQSAYRKWHDLRVNTRGGSRTNIAAHYDLGNDFFATFLDPSMTYSCGVFETQTAADSANQHNLEEAQRRKLDLVCRKLGLQPGHELVEIGTGWGGLAVHAAAHYGCTVTTATISEAQRIVADARIREAGVEDRVTVVSADYRDLTGLLGQHRFDRLVSIEMIEAVGEEFLGTLFDACGTLLKTDGFGLIQAIVIAESQYETYRSGTDFIQRYIFPGGFLPSLGAIHQAVRTTDLRVLDIEDITSHYPPTLRAWAGRIGSRTSKLHALGYSDDFLRLWAFYLAYCEGGFLERTIGDVQIVVGRPSVTLPNPLPRAPAFDDGSPPFPTEWLAT